MSVPTRPAFRTVEKCTFCGHRHAVVRLYPLGFTHVREWRIVTHRWECPSTLRGETCRPEDYPEAAAAAANDVHDTAISLHTIARGFDIREGLDIRQPLLPERAAELAVILRRAERMLVALAEERAR